jgi:ATP-dependent Clp protease adaptor protein ClpS
MSKSEFPLKVTNGRPNDSAAGDGGQTEGGSQTNSAVDTVQKLDVPRMYRVLLLNDDFTPMDFVVLVLKRFFGKDDEAATKIMLDVHQKGSGTAGIFTLEMAEMKVMQVNQFARMNQHPLKSTLEETQ